MSLKTPAKSPVGAGCRGEARGKLVPIFNNQTVLEIARGVKVFFNLQAGLTRGIVPDSGSPNALSEQMSQQLATKDQQIAELRARLARGSSKDGARHIDPANIAWIFGTARVGSTWLGAMMEDLKDHSVWHEPIVGELFGNFYYVRAGTRRGKYFIMGDRYKGVWLESIRNFVLDGATARFPGVAKKGHLIVKEPNGSIGAPLLMEALPESSMIFLVRDPRDVAASALDSSRKGSWLSNRKGDRAQNRTAMTEADPDGVVKGVSSGYMQYVGNSKQAYDSHKGPKVLVRYEELRANTFEEMRRIHAVLNIPVDERELDEVVEKHSWENIPQDKKGEGKFYRKGTPGGWSEDLTPGQIEIVEKTTAPLLMEYYPESLASTETGASRPTA